MNIDQLKPYLDRNARLILLDGKRPINANWRNLGFVGVSALSDWEGNVGWVLTHEDLVLDIDARNGGLESAEKLADDCRLRIPKSVKTPGGYHCYFQKSKYLKTVGGLKDYPGIDILTEGRQVVVVGSRTEQGEYQTINGQIEFHPLPKDLAKIIQRKENVEKNDESKIDELDVLDCLYRISPDVDYSTWIKIGMAVKSWDSGQRGFELWARWSKDGEKYKEGECEKKWRSFDGSGVSIGTLVHHAQSEKKKQRMSASETKDRWSEWFYLKQIDRFICIRDGYPVTQNTFNREMAGEVPVNKNGGRATAHKYSMDNLLVRSLDAMMYYPLCNDKVVKVDGLTYFNRFDVDKIPSADMEMTQAGKSVVELVSNHIELIFGSDAWIFVDWLAWQVQHIGRKLYWCPLVQSIEGLGKSFFRELLALVLGERNVGVISPDQLSGQFNSWAVNVAVNVLEELKLHGHNRYDAVNALKPLTTNRRIMVNEKHIKQYHCLNITNYLALTNHRDCIPMQQDDRRYWVIFAPYQSIRDFEKASGKNHTEYFQNLYDQCRKNPGQLRRWLLDHRIDDDFYTFVRAPESENKREMIKMHRELMDGYVEALDILDKPTGDYNSECIRSSPFWRAVTEDHGLKLKNWQKNKVLNELGYHLIGPVRFDGKMDRLWVRDPNMTVKRAVESLAATAVEDDFL